MLPTPRNIDQVTNISNKSLDLGLIIGNLWQVCRKQKNTNPAKVLGPEKMLADKKAKEKTPYSEMVDSYF